MTSFVLVNVTVSLTTPHYRQGLTLALRHLVAEVHVLTYPENLAMYTCMYVCVNE